MAVWLFGFTIKVMLKTKTFLWDHCFYHVPGALLLAYYVDKADKRRRGCWKNMCASILFWRIFPWVFSIFCSRLPGYEPYDTSPRCPAQHVHHDSAHCLNVASISDGSDPCAAVLVCNFFVLYYLLDMFANYPDAIGKWAGTLGLAFAQSWLVQDVLVILIRNNLNCTKTIVRSWKYAAVTHGRNEAGSSIAASAWPSHPPRHSVCTIMSVDFLFPHNPGNTNLEWLWLIAVHCSARRYQILEKFVVGPLRGVVEVFRGLLGLTLKL